MRRKALGKHRWSIVPGLLLCITAAGPVYAAPERTSTQIAIGNPLPNSLVAGRISLSVAYDRGIGEIKALTVFVDDAIQFSRSVLGTSQRGLQYLDLDTRTIPDGNHIVKVVAMGTRGPLAIDEVGITVRNGVAGGVDLVPPLVQVKGLRDGDTVSGKLNLDILAEDNSGMDLLVSVFVNRFPRLIKSRPPYNLELNTSEFLDPVTQRGTLLLEAWAYDKANNLGKSRQLTLNVVAPGKENETRKQDDPTRTPVATSPMIPDVPVKDLPAPAPNELVFPLAANSKPTEPTVPPAATGNPEGRPVIAPGAKTPGGKPATAALTQPGVTKSPAPQKGAVSAASLAGAKTATPAASRPRAIAAPVQGGVVAPAPVKAKAGDAAISGTRAATPALPPPASVQVTIKSSSPTAPLAVAPKPSVSATPSAPPAKPLQLTQAKPFNPEIVPPKAAPVVKPAQIASAKIEVSMPDIIDRPGELNEARVGTSVPVPSPGGARISMPTTERRVAKADQRSGLIVVTVDKKNRDKSGQPSLDIIRLSDFPADRDHRVSKSDSLHSIARKYGVTVKSLQVANGVTDGRALRAGSILKVPGAFDVVLNDKRVAFDVSPRVENGLPLTPFRQIMEYAGGVVVWDAEKQEINAANEQAAIKLKIGSKEALVNQTVIVMDREAFIDSGRTIVPISFMEKALDLKAEYDVKSGTIMLVRR